jgi:hypothetical protein
VATIPNVRGTAIAGRIKYARRRGGDAAVEKVIAQLGDRVVAARLRERAALPHDWYPLPVLIELTVALDRLFGKGDGSLIRELSGDVAEDNLKTIYRLFVRMLSPSYTAEKAMSLWRQYYDSGELVVTASEPNHLAFELRDFAMPHPVHCEAVAGWILRYGKLAGYAGATVVHSSCRGKGQPRCEFHARWQ